MTVNWGNVGNIATTVGIISGGIWWAMKRLTDRFDHVDDRINHLDDCLDEAKKEGISTAQRVKDEALATAAEAKREVLDQQELMKEALTIESAKTRATLQAHLDTEVPHLARIDRTLAWMAGKMGWSPQDFDGQ